MKAACLLLAALLSGGARAVAAPNTGTAPQVLPITAEACLVQGSAASGPPPCLQLEVPQGDRQYALGLQKRPPLPPGRGMWFAFRPAAPVRFWMHQTPAPLDMLFLREGRVVAIAANAAPCPHLPCRTYGSDTPVDGVLEVAAGQARALGLSEGSLLTIRSLGGAP